MTHVIIVCGGCKRPSVGAISQKSRKCPYCGSRIDLSRSKIVARAASAEDARMILCKEKERIYRSRKNKTSSRFNVYSRL